MNTPKPSLLRSLLHNTPALVIAMLALVVGLSSTAYAAGLAKNSVGTAQLKKNAVTSAKVKNGTLLAGDFAPGQLTAGARGPAGPQGTKGAQGDQGQQGQKGDQGDVGPAGSARGWAWVTAAGGIVTSGGKLGAPTVVRIQTGLYCIQWPNLGTYAPLIATLQGSDFTDGRVGVNTGWGSSCNPWGGDAVYTTNGAGAAADRAFVVALL